MKVQSFFTNMNSRKRKLLQSTLSRTMNNCTSCATLTDLLNSRYFVRTTLRLDRIIAISVSSVQIERRLPARNLIETFMNNFIRVLFAQKSRSTTERRRRSNFPKSIKCLLRGLWNARHTGTDRYRST